MRCLVSGATLAPVDTQCLLHLVFIPPLVIGGAATASATVGIILTPLAAACVVFIPLVIGAASVAVGVILTALAAATVVFIPLVISVACVTVGIILIPLVVTAVGIVWFCATRPVASEPHLSLLSYHLLTHQLFRVHGRQYASQN